jgi:Family of unknown function (DUF5678)
MTPTFEQTIEIINALPKTDQEKLFDWAEAKKRDNKIENNETIEQSRKFKLALQWIEKHKEEFDGQFVLLDGDKLLAHGKEAKKLYAEARVKGIEIPFVKRIKAKELPFGGW